MKRYRFLPLLLIAAAGCARQSYNAILPGSLTGSLFTASAANERPFPQSLTNPGCIKPDNKTQSQLNADVRDYYRYWKETHLRRSNGGTPGGGYYLHAETTGATSFPAKSTSEAHGYGMIIFALMGEKDIFDGMYNIYDRHRSSGNGHLMSWVLAQAETPGLAEESATDGDMDIAYALLLAHCQWGRNGAIDYLAQARRMITLGIRASEMGPSSMRTLLGDWSTEEYDSRPSDWRPGHLRAFHAATGDPVWLRAADNIYGMIRHLTKSYAPLTGLLPDYVAGTVPEPAPPHYLEGANDGRYYYNACRAPWRLATDYAHSGNALAKRQLDLLARWIRSSTLENPAAIRSGYHLNGRPLPGSGSFSCAFASPLITACIVDAAHQEYLNAGWELIRDRREGYDGDTINLLCMLLVSGNWWKPEIGAAPRQETEAPLPAPEVNIAKGKRVVVSSVEAAGLAGEFAVDGNLLTRWGSLEGRDPEWIFVDLGTSCEISRIVLYWETAYARAYSVQVSDDASGWRDIHVENAGDGVTDPILVTAAGRYVRLFGLSRGTRWGYSLREFEVYGPAK